jgi:hypothetical protein
MLLTGLAWPWVQATAPPEDLGFKIDPEKKEEWSKAF